MRLYKDYKEVQELQKKEAEDRAKLELPSETVIIYEQSPAITTIKAIGNILLLLLLLIGLGVVIVGMVYYAGGFLG